MKTGQKQGGEQEKNRKPGTWKPGESGNPAGRPKKGFSIKEVVQSMLVADPALKKALAQKWLQKALEGKGDFASLRLLIHYMDGMPVQPIVELDPNEYNEIHSKKAEEVLNKIKQASKKNAK